MGSNLVLRALGYRKRRQVKPLWRCGPDFATEAGQAPDETSASQRSLVQSVRVWSDAASDQTAYAFYSKGCGVGR